jgi:hypothetical protein
LRPACRPWRFGQRTRPAAFGRAGQHAGLVCSPGVPGHRVGPLCALHAPAGVPVRGVRRARRLGCWVGARPASRGRRVRLACSVGLRAPGWRARAMVSGRSAWLASWPPCCLMCWSGCPVGCTLGSGSATSVR